MAFSTSPETQPGSASQYQGKNRSGKSITFDAPYQVGWGASRNVAASQAESVVLDALPLAQASKFLRISITAAAVSGSPYIQVTDTATTNSACKSLLPVGPTGKGVTVACGNYTGQTIAAVAPDFQFASGTVLALRVTTSGADTVTGLRVTAELASRDEHPQQPILHALNTQSY